MGKWQMSNFNLEADKTDAPKSILRHRRARLMTRLEACVFEGEIFFK